MKAKIGVLSFVIGLVLAVVVSIFFASAPPAGAVFVLAILGVIVGLLNITDKEVQPFLIASISFLLSFQALSAVFKTIAFGWTAVGTFFNLLSVFIAPAAAIVAVKAIYNLAKD